MAAGLVTFKSICLPLPRHHMSASSCNHRHVHACTYTHTYAHAHTHTAKHPPVPAVYQQHMAV
eukprot:565265-Pelagomonas_calceolata.AAC.5